MDQAKEAYKELQEFFRHADPTHKREESVFEKLGYIDIQFLAARIRAEVLWAIGLMDTHMPAIHPVCRIQQDRFSQEHDDIS